MEKLYLRAVSLAMEGNTISEADLKEELGITLAQVTTLSF
jgi:hypothetical protein